MKKATCSLTLETIWLQEPGLMPPYALLMPVTPPDTSVMPQPSLMMV